MECLSTRIGDRALANPPAAAQALSDKYKALRGALAEMQRVVVAFSAGVDSTVVLKVALNQLGAQNVLAATGVSPSLARRELQSVEQLAAHLQAPLELVRTNELERPGYVANAKNRCYFCKSELYERLQKLAAPRNAVVVNGVNVDDTSDFRPGIQAAREFGVRTPLLEAGMTKSDVRELARELKLPNWEKPALACLSSRIPYGTPVTIESLGKIEEAEAFLWARGFANFRVRHHQQLARIEAQATDFERLLSEPLRSELLAHFRALGYTYVTLDIAGFRSGSGNETLSETEITPVGNAKIKS